ncbi:MAG TPA: L,D-transpeptidase [Chloroflexota bacterium]|nr:L,D-transpeptidase [Chloroflexota bacterium]
MSLKTETLRAYQGARVVYQTVVTTGGPLTTTPTGLFHVQGKYLGWVFHSPWPRSSPLWYPDSPSNFALLYEPTSGYFIHDAPWRSRYGPGSNSVAGTPGGNYTGSHGCTNVPYAVMARIFAWAAVGTPIRVA